MAFITAFDSLFFWFDEMRYKDIVVYFCMTFYASDILKMHGLVWKPLMCLQDADLFSFSEKLKTVKVGVTAKTDAVIVKNGRLDIFSIPDIDLIRMRIMTFPA